MNAFEEKDIKQITCDKHGNYQSVLVEFKDSMFWTNCPKCIEEEKRKQIIDEQKKQMVENKEREMKLLIGRACIPSYYEDVSFDNYNADSEEQKTILSHCKFFANNFDRAIVKGVQGLFVGGTGTGKGHLACSIIKKVTEMGYTALFTTMQDVLSSIRSTYNTKNNEQTILNKLYNIDLLVIDECAIDSTEFEQKTLFNIINKRIFDRKPSILITNELNNLEQKLGSRIISRITESNFIKEFKWDDYRTRKEC